MKQSRNLIRAALIALFPLVACDQPSAPSAPEQEAPTVIDLEQGVSLNEIAARFAEALQDRDSLAPFMAAEYTFVYHTSDRCDGQVDGEVKRLTGDAIDYSIEIQTTSDGKGWACPAREPYTATARFKLSDSLESWDRFEVQDVDSDSSTAYIVGEGESGYIVISLTASGAIQRLEYRNEDPG